MKKALLFSFLSVLGTLFAQNNDTAGSNQQAGITGFDGIAWGATYSDVKERFVALAQSKDVQEKIEIVNDIPEREILIMRKGILYRYVFYKKPLMKKDTKPAAPDMVNGTDDIPPGNEGQQTVAAPRFFFVESIFPLVASEDLYKKLSEKYGNRTNTSINEKEPRGAYIWDLPDGLLVQWLESYEKKPYTRNLYYISKQIRDEIRKDMQDYNYQREIKILDSILP